MPDPTPRAEKTDRMTRLLKVQDEIAMDLVRQQVGQTVRVLVEYGCPASPSPAPQRREPSGPLTTT